jgi:hypothetical protein
MRVVDIEGHSLHATVEGEGEPALAPVHGTPVA